MSSFFNFLKNLFSGIFAFLGGLLGSKKQKEAGTEALPKPKKSSAGYFLELDDAKGIGKAPATPPTPAKAATPEPVSEPPAETAKPKQTPASKAPAPSTEHTTAPAPTPAAVATALNLPQPTVTTFAPNYLVPAASSNGRRRPGANMTAFLDMARQVKTPS